MATIKNENPEITSASPDGSHIEAVDRMKAEKEALDDDPVYSIDEQRKIIHRVDLRLIIPTGVMYCVSLMDRSNLPNAAIAGMNAELEMDVGFRYSTIALVFFVTYVIFQPPTTILTRKLGPRPFLAGLCIAWGAVMIGFGFVTDWLQLIPLRLLLGLFEAGYFPGVVYLISTWYSRYDIQKRYACFYLIGILASGTSGILAYGLMQMDGIAGYSGWRWIFIIEGVMTIATGFMGYIFLVGFPDQVLKKPNWGFLKQEEVAFILRRVNKDRGDADSEKFDFKKWLASGADWKVWSFALIFFSLTTIAYAIGFFLQIILRQNMGFSVALSQCLTAPPYAAAGFMMLLLGWAGDKYHIRGPLLAANSILGLIGMPLLGFAEQTSARFVGVFLICMSIHGSIPCCMAYQANNIRGHWKRAFCSATLVGFGSIGGVAGSLVFRAQDRPHYRPGVYAGIACNLLVIILVVVNTIYFRSENRKADRGEKILEGDPNFRYTI